MMKKTKCRFPIRKRSYLLFELLLALGLLTLTLFPLVRTHIAMRKVESHHLQALAQERLSQEIFCTMKSKLYMWEHSWQELKGEVKGYVSIDEIDYPYTLESIDKHNKKNGMVLKATIKLPKYPVTRTLYVSR